MVAVIAAIPLACNGGESDPSEVFTAPGVTPAVRTEDGVTILEHAADAFERAPRMVADSEPLATIPATGPDSALDASYVLMLREGQLATLGGTRFRLFDRRGRELWRYDSAGTGPGAFSGPHGLAHGLGDTLLIPDLISGRIHRLIPRQGIVAQSPLAVLEGFRPDHLAGVLPSGEFVMHSAGVWGPRTRPTSDTASRSVAPVMAVDPTSGALRELARLPDLDLVRRVTGSGRARRTEFAPLRLGRMAEVAVWDSLVVTGTGDGYRLDLRAPDARVISQIRVLVPRRPVTAAIRQARIAQESERVRAGRAGTVDTTEALRRIEAAPFPDSLPPYSALFVTTGGILWVVDAIVPGEARWSATAFDRSGAILGRLTVEGSGVPVAFGNDRVVVREVDIDGGVVLRVRRIRQ
ncbi:MAG TPA: hypothetical protein VF178_10355 [Gemmatimonadaceae bacterium]